MRGDAEDRHRHQGPCPPDVLAGDAVEAEQGGAGEQRVDPQEHRVAAEPAADGQQPRSRLLNCDWTNPGVVTGSNAAEANETPLTPPNTSAWTWIGSDPWWVSHSPVVAYTAGSRNTSMFRAL